MRVKHDATCNKCGHEWLKTIKDDNIKGVRCPKCKNNGSISLRERDIVQEKPDRQITENTILPVCPYCYDVYEDDTVQAWGKIPCRKCGRIFKYCKKQTYTTEKISRDTPRESK